MSDGMDWKRANKMLRLSLALSNADHLSSIEIAVSELLGDLPNGQTIDMSPILDSFVGFDQTYQKTKS